MKLITGAVIVAVLAGCSREPAATTQNEPQPKWMREDFSRQTVAAVTATATDPDLKPYVPTREELAAAAKIGVQATPQVVVELAPFNIPEPEMSESNQAAFDKGVRLDRQAAEVVAAQRQAEAAAATAKAAKEESARQTAEAQRNADAIASAIRDAARRH